MILVAIDITWQCIQGLHPLQSYYDQYQKFTLCTKAPPSIQPIPYRITELRAELERRGGTETALEKQTRRQEVAIMELEASLANVREEIEQRQLEVKGLLLHERVLYSGGGCNQEESSYMMVGGVLCLYAGTQEYIHVDYSYDALVLELKLVSVYGVRFECISDNVIVIALFVSRTMVAWRHRDR